jgi:hypothetical protein
MSDPLIGVVGGYGAVGGAAAAMLAAEGVGRLRIGGRRREEAQRFVTTELAGTGEAIEVDVENPESLARFCAGCTVVVNAAGPSYRILDRVARAAFTAGADYVDPGGDDPVHQRLSAALAASPGRTAVLNAGVMPGLTAVLPRWLAGQGFERCDRLIAYVALIDHMTPAGAGDYLLSLGGGFGEAHAAWINGRRVSGALVPLSQIELPFFSGRITAFPFLSTETERLAREMGLVEIRWYNVFDEAAHVLAALGRLQGAMTGEGDLAAAAAVLTQAAELDLFGRVPYQLLVFQLEGQAAGRRVSRAAVLRAANTYRLTGAVTARAVLAILRGHIRPGVHFAAAALDPDMLVGQLRRHPAVSMLDLIDGLPELADTMEEGAV